MGARGLDEANILAKQLRRADLQGTARGVAMKGLEKYGERKKALTRAANQAAGNVTRGFV
jgi:hypothetical protein